MSKFASALELKEIKMSLSSQSRYLGERASRLAALEKAGANIPPSVVIKPTQVSKWLNAIPQFKAAINQSQLWTEITLEKKLAEIRLILTKAEAPTNWQVTAKKINRLRSNPTTNLVFYSNFNATSQNNVQFDDLSSSYTVETCNSKNLWKAFIQMISASYEVTVIENLYLSGISPLDFAPGVLIQPELKVKIAGQAISRNPDFPFQPSLENKKTDQKNSIGLIQWTRAENKNKKITYHQQAQLNANSIQDTPPLELDHFWKDLRALSIDADQTFNQLAEIEWIWDGEKVWVTQIHLKTDELTTLMKLSPSEQQWSRTGISARYPESMSLSSWELLQRQAENSSKFANKTLGLGLNKNLITNYQGFIYSNDLLSTIISSHSKEIKAQQIWKTTGKWLVRNSYQSNWVLLKKWVRVSTSRIVQTMSANEDQNIKTQKLIETALFNILLNSKTTVPNSSFILSQWEKDKRRGLQKLKEFNHQLKSQLESQDAKRNISSNLEKLNNIRSEFHQTEIAIEFSKIKIAETITSLFDATFNSTEPNFDLQDLMATTKGTFSSKYTSENLSNDLRKIAEVLAEEPNSLDFINELSQAQTIDQSIEKSAVLQSEASLHWQKFILTHQHVSHQWELSKPSWGECPSQLAPILQNYITLEVKNNSSSLGHSTQRKAALQTIKDILTKKGFENAREITLSLADLLTTFDNLVAAEAEQSYLAGKFLHPMKVLYSVAGLYLFELNQLEKSSDCFHLSSDEIFSSMQGKGIQWQSLVKERKQQLAKQPINIETTLPPQTVKRDPEVEKDSTLGSTLGSKLATTSVIKGIMQGRIITTSAVVDNNTPIEPGSILLSQSLSSENIPLYPVLGGLISETNEPFSPASIAANNHNLPFATTSQYSELINLVGKEVSIDSYNGEVTVL